MIYGNIFLAESVNNIKWKYATTVDDKSIINNIENKYNFKIPSILKTYLIKYNNGSPNLKRFKLKNGDERVFGSFVSLNAQGDDSGDYIGVFINSFEINNGKSLKLFPFALDPAGNVIGIDKNGKVIFFDHETDEYIYISNSFVEFLKSLY